MVADILPVVDNFELALSSVADAADDSLAQGVRMIHQMMLKSFADHGVEEIPTVGEKFDPEVHEAVMMEGVTEGEDGDILEVQQKGYTHKGFVIRPSRVTVARRIESAESESS